MGTNTRPNRDIRRAAAFSGVCLWQIADSLGITDANFSRKLRRELPADEKEKIIRHFTFAPSTESITSR